MLVDRIYVNRQNSIMRNNLFNRLTIPQQAEVLLEEGVYLHTREEPGFFVDLYEMHGLYIEVTFIKSRKILNSKLINSLYLTKKIRSKKIN